MEPLTLLGYGEEYLKRMAISTLTRVSKVSGWENWRNSYTESYYTGDFCSMAYPPPDEKNTRGGSGSIVTRSVLSPDMKDFFEVANQHPQMKTFIFGKPGEAKSYRVLNNTFDWICDDRLYNHLTTKEKHHFPAWYPNACEKNISNSFVSRYELDDLFWRGKRKQDLSQDMIRNADGLLVPTFMTIVANATISPLGYVFSKNVKLAHMQCARDNSLKVPNFPPNVPYYEEVFVISQYWGRGSVPRHRGGPHPGRTLHIIPKAAPEHQNPYGQF